MALNLTLNGMVFADGTGTVIFTGTSDLFGPINLTINALQNVLTNASSLTGTITDGPGSGGGGIIAGLRPLIMGAFEDGEDGLPGIQGIKGDTGATGATGTAGIAGQPGLFGQDGEDGQDGIHGARGLTGLSGQSGLSGQDGEDGQDGLPGTIGATGASGAAGSTGVQGVAGIPWFDVENGEDGLMGGPGTTGALGATGSVGAQLLYSNITVPAGNTIASTAVETAFTSSYTIPANSLVAGDVLDIWIRGVYSTALVAPTGRLKIKIGSTVILDTGTLSTLVTVTNDEWWMHGQVVVQSIGAGGQLECQGDAEFSTTATAALTIGTGNTAAITVDTTVLETITSTFTWGTSSSSNTITLREMIVNRGTTTPIGSGGGYPSGTSNPINTALSPFYRTDLNYLIYYDGTRWLTVNEYETPLSILTALQAIAATATRVQSGMIRADFQLYITKIGLVSQLSGGTNNSTNKWVIALNWFTTAGVSTTLVSYDTSTTPDSTTNWVNHDTAVNATLSTTALEWQLAATKTGAPSNILVMCNVRYRLVIT